MRLLKDSALFCLGFLCIMALFEFLLSFGGIMTPIVKIDPEKGQRYVSNKTCCSIFINEGFGLSETNASGWFGSNRESSQRKEISIAVVGNSFVASRQVFYRDNFISIAEQLTNQSGIPASYKNFGKESVTLREALFIKQEIDSAINPDYYIVLVNETFFGSEGRNIPYYELKEGQLKLNNDFKESFLVKQYDKLEYISKSAVLFLMFRVKNRVPQAMEILLDKFYWGTKADTNAEETDRPIDALDESLIKELDKDKRVIFLLDLSTAKSEKVKSLIQKSLVIELRKPLQKMQKDLGIDPCFWEISDVKGHWNRPAHKVIGKELAKSMIRVISSRGINN